MANIFNAPGARASRLHFPLWNLPRPYLGAPASCRFYTEH